MSEVLEEHGGTVNRRGSLGGLRIARNFLPRAKVDRLPWLMIPLWAIAGTLLYALHWSALFAPLRADTLSFLALITLLSVASIALLPSAPPRSNAAALSPFVVAVIVAYFVVAYIKTGGIPVVLMMTGANYDPYSFGINGLHVFMLCVTGYYGVRAMNAFISSRGVANLATAALMVVLLGSIGNRSAVTFLVFAWGVLYIRSRHMKWPTWIALVIIGLGFVYLLGVYGDLRLAHQITQATGVPATPDAILRYARATDEFLATAISPSFMWGYLYFVSPIANLNQAFAYSGGGLCGNSCDVPALVVNNWLPDVIGTRLGPWLNVNQLDKQVFIVAPDVTASTAFGSAAATAGWLGAVSVIVLLIVVGIVAVWLLRRSTVHSEGIALLATVLFFSFFENMITYTPMIGQLLLALIVAILPNALRNRVRALHDQAQSRIAAAVGYRLTGKGRRRGHSQVDTGQ